MIDGMDGDDLAGFVAAVWERQGWETRPTTRDGRRFVVVTRDGSERERGLIWVVAKPEGSIGTKPITEFHAFCDRNDAGEAAVVTTGSIAPGAKRPAEQLGIGLLDGDDLRELVRTHDLFDLATRYGGGAGGADAGTPVDRVRAALSRARAAGPPVSARGVVVVFLALAVLVAGVLVGPSLLNFGGGDQSVESITARSSIPAISDGVLLVSWDAARRDVIDPNPDDGTAYYPREGRTFLVVELRITNAGSAAVPVRETGFLVETNGTLSGHQPLTGADAFPDRELVPGETLVGWISFSVPADATNSTLVADGNAFGPGNVTVEFSRDTELDVTTA